MRKNYGQVHGMDILYIIYSSQYNFTKPLIKSTKFHEKAVYFLTFKGIIKRLSKMYDLGKDNTQIFI